MTPTLVFRNAFRAVFVASCIVAPLPVAGQYAAVVLEDEPISYWRFEDDDDTATDSGSSGTDGEYFGVAKLEGDLAPLGKYAQFEDNPGGSNIDFGEPGAGSLLQLTNADTLGEEDPDKATSVEFWLKTAMVAQSPDNWRTGLLFGEESGGDGDVQWGDIRPSGSISFTLNDANHLHHESSQAVNDDEWHHVVITYDWGTQTSQLYVDGVAEDDFTGGDNIYTDDDAEIQYMGWNSLGEGGQGQYIGCFDEVAIYDKILSADRVAVHFDAAFPDTDGDGMKDFYEVANELDINVDDSGLDKDGDGLNNLFEFQNGLKANNADSDGDGLSDGAEVNEHETDPLNPDSDGDGLTDGNEIEIMTDPNKEDTDGDGFSDSFELNPGEGIDPTDPKDPDSKPNLGGGYSGAVLADQPISYWRFDDPGNTATDLGASMTNGKYVGITLVDGYQGTAAKFEDDPGNSHIDFGEFGVGSLAQLVNDDSAGEEDPEQQTTLEFWMKTAQEGQDASNWRTATVFGEESGGDGDIQWAYILPTGQLGAIAVNDQHLHVSDNEINDDEWHHYAITYDWATFTSQLYIDGELESDLEGGDNVFTDFDGNIRYMGWNSVGQGGQGQFVGLLDEVAIYDKILSAERVQIHAAFPRTLPGDRDGDGLSDIFEEATEGLDPDNPADATEDADGDGLDNKTEILTTGTDFMKADTDGDGLNDKVEVDGGLDPLNADTDGDGLSDGVETNTGIFVGPTDTGTDPKKTDTDGDQIGDATEIEFGTDPTDPNSKPKLSWADVIAAADPAYWYRFNGESTADGVENQGRVDGFAGTFSNKVADADLGKESAFPSLGTAFEFTGPPPEDIFHTEDPDAYSDGASFVDFGEVIPELTNLRSDPMDKSTTVEYWLKTAHVATTGNQTWNSPALLSHESGGDGDMYWGWIRDDGDFGFSTSDIREIHSVRDADYEVTDNEWHHVMMVKDWKEDGPTTSALYIDGGAVSGGATIEATTANGNASQQDDDGQIQYLGFVEKGRDGDANVQYIGLFDELVIYDKALTEQDAALHYLAGITGPPDRGGTGLGFRITKLERNPAGTEVVVTWSSREGRAYIVESSTNFVNWTELADGVEGEADTTSYTDTAIPADATVLYYRIKEE